MVSEPSGLLYSDRTGTRAFLSALVTHYRWRLGLLLLLNLLVGVSSGLGILTLVPLLQVVGFDLGSGALAEVGQVVESLFDVAGVEPNLPAALLLYVALVGAGAALSRWQSLLSATMQASFVSTLRMRLYQAVVGAEWRYFSLERPSAINHLIIGEIERVGGAVLSLANLLSRACLASAYLTLALLMAPAATLLVGACGAALALLQWRRTQLGRRAGEEVSTAYGELYGAAEEHLAGLKVAKSHGLEAEQVERFRASALKAAHSQVGLARNQADLSFALQLGSVLILAVVAYAALAVLQLPMATLMILLLLFARLIPMLSSLQKGYQSLINLLPAFDAVRAALDRARGFAEPAASNSRRRGLGQGLELRSVVLRYGGADQAPTLKGVDLRLPAGQTTAIVGPSGAGKSTIADLAVGLLGPDEGEVLIDGEPLDGQRRHSWRTEVGYVGQDPFLFHDTIRANLLFVNPGASEAQLWEALRDASAEFVAELPAGLDTVVGNRGGRLSGGERQRISLARALLRRPSLLVLDEATSALDAENDERIWKVVDALRGRMTILVIAHRLATVRSADTIHVLEAGRVVESGTFAALARRGGRFRAMCQAQGLELDQPTVEMELAGEPRLLAGSGE